jgi:D-alanine-D-alanine ligase
MIAHLGKDKYKVMPIKLNNKKELIEKAKDLDIALLALHGQ